MIRRHFLKALAPVILMGTTLASHIVESRKPRKPTIIRGRVFNGLDADLEAKIADESILFVDCKFLVHPGSFQPYIPLLTQAGRMKHCTIQFLAGVHAMKTYIEIPRPEADMYLARLKGR